MIPDLPMPVRITRPLHWRSSWTAQSNLPSSRSTSDRIALASVSRILRASWRSATERHLGLVAPQRAKTARWGPRLCDRVDGHQAMQERLELVEAQCVLRIALRARRFFVHFDEHAVDAGRHTSRCERLDELRLSGGDAIAAAG